MHEIYRPRNQTEQPAEDKIFYTLSTNLTVQQLIDKIGRTPPDINAIQELLNKGIITNNGNGRSKSKNGDYIGRMAEWHTAATINQMRGLFPSIDISPIPDDSLKGKYRFRQKGINYVVFREPRPLSAILEYDILSVIDGLPVVWEVKLGHTIQTAIRSKRIIDVFKPLSEYYDRTDFGYVLVVPKDVPDENSVAQNKFIERGGIIASLYGTKEQFQSDLGLTQQSE